MKRRLLWTGLAVVALLVLLGAWAGWTAYRVNQDLSAAVDDANALRDAATSGDDAATRTALDGLKRHATAAADRTDGLTWSALGHLPVVGDDARGIGTASTVARDLAADGVEPLLAVSDSVDSIVGGHGRVDLRALVALKASVSQGSAAFDAADADLRAQDSSGFVGPLRTKYVDLADQVSEASRALRGADTTLAVLPTMLGKDGPQDYLLVFQNNAEIRSTGGIPGSWALLHTDDGRLTLTAQGTGGKYPALKPPLPISKAERTLFGLQLGAFFVDANVTPDFPRAADLLRTRWQREVPGTTLDGVISLDPVAMSYLLAGTGPVQVDGRTLTEDNVVSELLNRPYLELTPDQQDIFFAQAARAVFEAVTGSPKSPTDLVSGMTRAVRERRLLVASFDPTIERKLAGEPVTGALRTGADGASTVDVALNDGTGGKMSYYLRYDVAMSSDSCQGGAQQLSGTMTMSQTLPKAEAAQLPDYLTADGYYGVEPGTQVDTVHLFAPTGGRVAEVRIDGKKVPLERVDLDGREAASVVISVDGPTPVKLTWTMTTAAGTTGDVDVHVTPGVESGSKDSIVASSC